MILGYEKAARQPHLVLEILAPRVSFGGEEIIRRSGLLVFSSRVWTPPSGGAQALSLAKSRAGSLSLAVNIEDLLAASAPSLAIYAHPHYAAPTFRALCAFPPRGQLKASNGLFDFSRSL